MDSNKRRLSLGEIIRKMSEGSKAARQPSAPAPDGGQPGAGSQQASRSARQSLGFPPLPQELPDQPAYREKSPPVNPSDPKQPATSNPATDEAPAATAQLPLGQIPEDRPGGASLPPPEQPPAARLPSDGENEQEFDIFRYVAVVVRRKEIVLGVTVLVTAFSLFSYMRAQKFYTAGARLLFRPAEENVLPDQMERYGGDETQKFNTHLEMLHSAVVLERVAQNMGGAVSAGEIAGGLTINQGQTNGEKNDIIELTLRNPKAEIARDALNELCRTYIDYHREVNAQEKTRLIMNLKTQIDKLEASLSEKEDAVRRFKEQNHLVQISSETQLVATKMGNMQVALQQTQLDLLSSKEQMTALKSQIKQQDVDVVSSMTYDNPYQSKLGELELELNTLTADYGPDHYKIKLVKEEIEKIKGAMHSDMTRNATSQTFIKNPTREKMIEELVTQTINIATLEAKRAAQEQIVEQLKQDVLKLPSLEQQYAFLQRESESILTTLTMLKNTYEAAKVERDSKESDIKVLEMAGLPGAAVSSKKPSSVLMGLLVGLMLGVALAFILEYLDQTFKDASQVEKQLEVPLLGVVPHIETDKTLTEETEKLAKSILEPFRALRVNLKHLTALHQAKLLMICSAVKGEGKTTLATNLALTFAMDGRKVILVDGDLRRSQIHHYLNVSKEVGFCDYLIGEKDLDGIIKPTRYENLSVITSGERPHNPAELLGTERFDQMLAELRPKADIVLFDSPALLPVSDSLIMAPKMDACMMVVRTMWTPVPAALQAKSQLTRIGAKIFGCICNGVPQSRGYYPYYYGYYGYYAYRYSYDEEPRKRFTIREFGLKAEKKLKAAIEQGRAAVPRYFARAATFVWSLGRRPLIWLLIVALVLVSALQVYMQNRRRVALAGAEMRVAYIDGKVPPPAIAVSPMPVQSGQTLGGPDSLGQVGTSRPGVNRPAGPDTGFAYKDSLALWLDAWNKRDMQSYARFYDSVEFRYPGGGLPQWLGQVSTKWLPQSPDGGIIDIDSLSAQEERGTYWRTFLNATRRAKSQTTRLQDIMIWHRQNGNWRIIREKTQTVE